MKFNPSSQTKAKGAVPRLDLGHSAGRPNSRKSLAWLSGNRLAGQPLSSTWSVNRAIEQSVGRVVWVFRACHSIADAQARLPIVQRRDNRERGPVVDDHFTLPLLNSFPNPYQSAYWLRYALSFQVLLSKKGAFVEVIRNQAGYPTALYLLPPDNVRPIPDPDTWVSGYEVDLGRGQKVTKRPQDVLWFGLPHPTDPYASLTPLESAGLSVDTDILARLYNRTFLANDGRPGGIVAVKGDSDDDTMDELEDRWNPPTADEVGFSGRAFSTANRITVVEADGLDWVDTATSPRDAQYVESMKGTKEALLGAFGVPESIATGNASGRTFENVDAEREIFWDPTMLGHLTLVGGGFDRLDGDPSIFTGFDLSGVTVLQRHEDNRRKQMAEEVAAGLRTLDSYLEETGREPTNTPEGRSYLMPMGLVPFVTEGQSNPVANPTAQALQAAAVLSAVETKARELLTGARPSTGVVVPPFALAPSGVKARPEPGSEADPFRLERKAREETLASQEAALYQACRDFFVAQEAAVLGKLVSTKARQGTRHWDYGSDYVEGLERKDLDPSRIFNLDYWRSETVKALRGIVQRILDFWGKRTADGISNAWVVEVAWNLHDDNVTAALAERTNRLARTADTTWEAVRLAIIDGEMAGETIEQIAARIETVFTSAKGYRARTIARTETVGAANDGAMLSADQSGVVGSKIWLATSDARTRDTHLTADGQEKAMGEKFAVGASTMDRPGDPTAPASEVVNCRCTLLFRPDANQVDNASALAVA